MEGKYQPTKESEKSGNGSETTLIDHSASTAAKINNELKKIQYNGSINEGKSMNCPVT